MSSAWQHVALGDVCQVIGGGTPSKDTPEYYAGDIPWATVRDMRFDVISDTEFKITKAAVAASATNVVPAGNVVIATRVGLGKVCLLGQDTAINQDLRGIIPSKGSNLSVRFLYWWLKSVSDVIVDAGTGATVQGVKLPFIKSLKIPLPSLSEQQRIVAILDEAFEGIATAKANAEKNLQNAEELFSSYRDSVLSGEGLEWQYQKLSDLCEVKHGFAFKSEHFAQSGEYVLLTPGNFYESGGYRDRGEKQKYYTGEIPPGFILSEGDLLVAMTEQAAGLLGSPIIVPESGLFLHNQRLGLVKPKVGVPWLNSFFFHVFNLPSFRREVHASATGVKVRHTSPSKIGEIEVAFPSDLSVQKQIVSRLDLLSDEVARLGAVFKQKLSALDDLKKSLLHHAFSGQL